MPDDAVPDDAVRGGAVRGGAAPGGAAAGGAAPSWPVTPGEPATPGQPVAPGEPVAPHEPPAPRGRESFAQRLPVVVLYAVLGAIVGVVGSFTHRSRFDLGELTIWYGVVVGIACVAAFSIGLRLNSPRRSVSVAFAGGLIAGILLIAFGLGGSVVILGDLAGMLWLAVPPIIAFGAAFWPSIDAARQDARRAPAVGEPVTERPAPAAEVARGYPETEPPASPPHEPTFQEPKQ